MVPSILLDPLCDVMYLLPAVCVGLAMESNLSLNFVKIFQILSEKEPFFSVHHDTTIMLKVLAGERPERSSYPQNTFTNNMWVLVVDCWDRVPGNRPAIRTVVERLETM